MLSCSRVDKRSLVTVARNRYSVPVRYAHHEVSIKRFADRVEVWHEQSRIARHDRSYEQGQFILEPEHYLNLLMTQYPVEQVKSAVAVCVRRRAFSHDAVVTVLRNEPVKPTASLDLSQRPELSQMHDGIRPLGDDDQLAAAAVEAEVAV